VFDGPDTSVVEVPSRDGREVMLVAALPFLSQRWVVKASQLMGGEASESVQLYEHRYRQLTAWLCSRFRSDTVNVVAAHAFVHGSGPVIIIEWADTNVAGWHTAQQIADVLREELEKRVKQ
jgi:hypothetical protein